MDEGIHKMMLKHLKNFNSIQIKGFDDQSRTYGDVECFKVLLWPKDEIHKQVQGAFLRIERTSHAPHTIELICEQHLREFFPINDGDSVCFQLIG